MQSLQDDILLASLESQLRIERVRLSSLQEYQPSDYQYRFFVCSNIIDEIESQIEEIKTKNAKK